MSKVLFKETDTGVGIITLNRPEAINSLHKEMLIKINDKLVNWENDPRIKLVIFKGAGEKGFCAGGDVKALHKARNNDTKMKEAEHFFEVEYETDQLIYQFPKPIIANLDGVVMGGGIGITYGASHRIITENTKWAMPEMNIGLFPDVGASYFLNKAPGEIGKYLGLTASVIKAPDICYINAADKYIKHKDLPSLLTEITETDWHVKGVDELDQLIRKYQASPEDSSYLQSVQAIIDQHFSYHSVEEILQSLESDFHSFAQETMKTMQSKSPVSLKVTLAHLLTSKNKSLASCFATDLTLAKNFLRHNDFYEGVRAVLIDKDKRPNYQYKTLADVSDAFVQSFFHS